MALVLNILMLALEACGFALSRIPQRRWRLLIFYTQLSNMLATASALLLVALGQPAWVTLLRYASTCMLVMTALVTICVLVPLGGDPHELLWSGNGLYHHVLCPALCVVSYVAAENHAPFAAFPLPVALTLLYGLVMIALNAARVVEGPYPFFRVHEQSVAASVLWVLVLLLVIAGISYAVQTVAPCT